MNFLDISGANYDKEREEKILVKDNIQIEKILSLGQTTDWMEGDQDEWVLVLQGYGVIEWAQGEKVRLGPGDYLNIPKGQRHRVCETAQDQATLWLAIFY